MVSPRGGGVPSQYLLGPSVEDAILAVCSGTTGGASAHPSLHVSIHLLAPSLPIFWHHSGSSVESSCISYGERESAS